MRLTDVGYHIQSQVQGHLQTEIFLLDRSVNLNNYKNVKNCFYNYVNYFKSFVKQMFFSDSDL